MGRMAALAICVLCLRNGGRAASTIVAAADYSIKSTDGGTTWQPIVANANNALLPGNARLFNLAVSPANSGLWYAVGGAQASGLYRTADSGKTWSAKPLVGISPFSGDGGLAIDAATETVYLISTSGTQQYVVRTTDAGATWTTHKLPFTTYYDQGHFPSGPPVQSIKADPGVSGVLYATVDATIFKTADYGETWTILVSGLDTPGIQLNLGAPVIGGVEIDPRNSQVLYARTRVLGVPCMNSTPGNQCGLYRSSDGGQTWSALALPSKYSYSLAIDPGSGSLYVGTEPGGLGPSILKSVDGGATWAPIKNGFLGGAGSTGPVVLVDPANPSTVYAAEYYGSVQSSFYRSTDGGASWTTIRLPNDCVASGNLPQCATALSPRFSQLVVLPPPPAPPAIVANGVVNGASFQAGVVANSWVTITGTSLATVTDDWSKSIVNGKLPIILDGVSVSIGGKPAYIYYISPGQINALAPDIPAGPVTVTVTTSGGVSSAFTTTASQYGPAFFTWPGSQPVATRQDFTFAAKPGTFGGLPVVAAKPGDVLVLWGTGFGPTSPVAPPGFAVPGDTTYGTATLPVVTINNVAATVYGAVLSPGAAGLYQIAIQVPTTLADGDWPVQATIGGAQSPATVLLTVRK
jgi:uncharacterized protein (TIGR03437 family)